MLLYLSIFTIGISLILIYNNWKTNKHTILLSCYFIIISIYAITHYLVMSGVSVFWTSIFYNNFSPLMLLLGPFLFLYIKNSLTKNNSIKKIELLHFTPAIIHLIGVIPYYLTSFDYKKSVATKIIQNVNFVKVIKVNSIYTPSVSFIIRPLLLTIYIVASYIILFKFYKKNKIIQSEINSTMKWLITLLTTSLLITINFFAITINAILDKDILYLKNECVLLISGISFFILAFSLLLFPKILYGFGENIILDNMEKNNKIVKTKKNNSNIDEELEVKLKNYIENQMPYLDQNFSLQNLSLILNIHPNKTSLLIKNIYDKKFNDLKNELRISYAKKMIMSNEMNQLTIDGIAKTSGFKSRSNFYDVFKAETGITPTEYQILYQKQAKENLPQ